MISRDFFRKHIGKLTLDEVLKLTDSTLLDKKADLSRSIFGVNTLKEANKDEIAFLTNMKYLEDLENSKAGFCFVSEKYADRAPKGMTVLINKNSHYAYTQVLNKLYLVPLFDVEPGIAETAYISKTAKMKDGVQICHGAYIGENVKLGKGCKIGVNAVINHNCEIGEGTYVGDTTTISYSKIGKYTMIQAGARIGQCGFGFAHHQGFNYKIPQIGLVIIGDYVEIGSCTCIDRGALENTEIGDNTKIDNLLQIAHGVKIGKGCFFAGGTVIAGSVKIGNFVQVGGNTSLNGHIEIGDGCKIAGHSAVLKSVEPMQVVGGIPAIPTREWHRLNVKLLKMSKK